MTDAATVHVDLPKIEQNCRALTSLTARRGRRGGHQGHGRQPRRRAGDACRGGLRRWPTRAWRTSPACAHAGVEATYWLLRAPAPARPTRWSGWPTSRWSRSYDGARARRRGSARGGHPRRGLHGRRRRPARRRVPADLLPFVEAATPCPAFAWRASASTSPATAPSCRRCELGQVAELAAQAESLLGRPLLVSGGNSGSLPLALRGELPPGIASLRVGESILLGLNTLDRTPLLPELHLDAFILTAPVIECLVKPSLPIGVCAQDMMGSVPVYEDRGTRRRAILPSAARTWCPSSSGRWTLACRSWGLQRPPPHRRGGRAPDAPAGRRVRFHPATAPCCNSSRRLC